MGNLAQRIKEIRNDLNLNRRDFAQLINAKKTRVENIEYGVIKKLKEQEIQRLLDIGYNIKWLKEGMGLKKDETNNINSLEPDLATNVLIAYEGIDEWLFNNRTNIEPSLKKEIAEFIALIINTKKGYKPKTDAIRDYLVPYCINLMSESNFNSNCYGTLSLKTK